MSRIQVVDDEASLCRAFRESLGDDGHLVDVAASAGEWLKIASANRPGAVVLDGLKSRPSVGNVREPHNAIEHAAIVARGRKIRPEPLPPVTNAPVSDAPGPGAGLHDRFLGMAEPPCPAPCPTIADKTASPPTCSASAARRPVKSSRNTGSGESGRRGRGGVSR